MDFARGNRVYPRDGLYREVRAGALRQNFWLDGVKPFGDCEKTVFWPFFAFLGKNGSAVVSTVITKCGLLILLLFLKIRKFKKFTKNCRLFIFE